MVHETLLASRENTKKEFNIFWDKGTNNNADYFTKNNPTHYHLHVRQSFRHVRGIGLQHENKPLTCP